jgi:two-component SAPR family response regulator
MIKAIAVDDEPLALDLIETYCSNFDFLQYEKGFTKTGVALQYLEKNPIDLLFLDTTVLLKSISVL